jgi:hypothetical protein
MVLYTIFRVGSMDILYFLLDLFRNTFSVFVFDRKQKKTFSLGMFFPEFAYQDFIFCVLIIGKMLSFVLNYQYTIVF